MAIARIEVLRGLTPEEKRVRLDAVHTSVVEALRVPADDPTVQLTERNPENVLLPVARRRATPSSR